MKREHILLNICLLLLCSCSTANVTVPNVRMYEGNPLPESKTAILGGIWGWFGGGIATAVCGVDEMKYDPCVIGVELLPGEYTVNVRLIIGNSWIYRKYRMEFVAGSEYQVRPKKNEDSTEYPVIEFYKFRKKDFSELIEFFNFSNN